MKFRNCDKQHKIELIRALRFSETVTLGELLRWQYVGFLAAMAVTASQTTLSGLPRRLVQDGIVSEEIVLEASLKPPRKAKEPLVAYLVDKELANPRSIAVAASHEFGVPLMDLDAIEIECRNVIRAVDQKLLMQASRLAVGQAWVSGCSWAYPIRLICRPSTTSSSRPACASTRSWSRKAS